VKQALEAGSHRQHRHEEMAMAALTTAGWKVDYVVLRNQAALAPPGAHDTELVVLGAAWLGKTRLIDNMEIRVKA
jgi:pantoate--beta-alanine ligase